MKHIFFTLLFICVTIGALAQPERISMNVIVPEGNIPAEAQKQLVSKLRQMATNYGLADNGLTDRFFITAEALVVSKDIVPTTPPRVSQKLEIIVYIGDVLENKIYGSLPLQVTGVGQNENKAFINAFQKIPTRSTQIENFMDVVFYSIVSFYEDRGNEIIKEAQINAEMGNYDEALAKLLSIPDVCGEVTDKSREVALAIYQQKVAKEGQNVLRQAKAIWAAHQDMEGAVDALALLADISDESGCASERDSLASTIQNKLNELKIAENEEKQKRWDFQMKQYQDNLELQRQQLKDQTAIERAKASAINTASKKLGEIDINKVINIVSGWFKVSNN